MPRCGDGAADGEAEEEGGDEEICDDDNEMDEIDDVRVSDMRRKAILVDILKVLLLPCENLSNPKKSLVGSVRIQIDENSKTKENIISLCRCVRRCVRESMEPIPS